MDCSRCGAEIPPGATFCHSCGALAPSEPPPAVRGPPTPVVAPRRGDRATPPYLSLQPHPMGLPPPPPPPYRVPPQGYGIKVSKLALVGFLLGVVCMVLSSVALVGNNWYAYDLSNPDMMGLEVEMEFGLWDVKMSLSAMGESMTETYSYSSGGGVDPEDETFQVIKRTRNLALAGLVFSIVFLVLALVAGLGLLDRDRTAMRLLPTLFGVLTCLFLVLASIVFALQFPGTVEDGFDLEGTGGGSLSHSLYICAVSGILAILGAPLAMGRRPATVVQPLSSPPPADPEGAPPPPQPVRPGANHPRNLK